MSSLTYFTCNGLISATADDYLDQSKPYKEYYQLAQRAKPYMIRADFPDLQLIGRYGLNSWLNDCNNLICAYFPVLTEISGYGACQGLFENCYNLEEVSFPNLSTIIADNSDYAFTWAFKNCKKLKSIDFSALKGNSGDFSSAFEGCSSLTSANFSNITSIPSYKFSRAFMNHSNSLSVDFSSLKTIGFFGMDSTFYCDDDHQSALNGGSLTFPELEYIDTCGMLSSFVGNLAFIYDFPKLTTVEIDAFESAFGSNSILYQLRFPMLTSVAEGAFRDALYGSFSDIGIILVHFRADMESELSTHFDILNGMNNANTMIIYDL